jgi:hypothetical protein
MEQIASATRTGRGGESSITHKVTFGHEADMASRPFQKNGIVFTKGDQVGIRANVQGKKEIMQRIEAEFKRRYGNDTVTVFYGARVFFFTKGVSTKMVMTCPCQGHFDDFVEAMTSIVYSVDSTITIENTIPVGFKLDTKWVETLEIYLNYDNDGTDSVLMQGPATYFAKHIIYPEGTTVADARYIGGLNKFWTVSSQHFKNIWQAIRTMGFTIEAHDMVSEEEYIGIEPVDAYCA